MPVATTRVRRERVARPLKTTFKIENSTKPKATQLQHISADETLSYQADLNDPCFTEYIFYNSEDPFEYPFKDTDTVWIRTREGKWLSGQVSGLAIRIGRTRTRRDGRFYPVKFGHKRNLRKFFAPGNGEIKPDTPEVRAMLVEEGLIDQDTDTRDETSSDESTYMN